MDILLGLCTVIAFIYFISKKSPSNISNINLSNLHHVDTSNRYNNVFEVWVCGELSPECQKVLHDIYNYNGELYIQSLDDWLGEGEKVYQSYIEHNSKWTEDNDNYISSLEKYSNIIRILTGTYGSMAVWCDKNENWACNRRVFIYGKDGLER